MLHRVFGLHGTGKSEYLYGKLEEIIRAGKRAFLIVPEQQTVSTERLLIDRFGNPANAYVEVINFKRLCNRVFRECGGLVGETPEKAARLLVMAQVCGQMGDELKIYRTMAHQPDFALGLFETVTEMHRERITGDELDAVLAKVQQAGGGTLCAKLHDVALLYRGYEAYLTQNLPYTGDRLDKLYETLGTFDFFREYTVFIDSFYGFTAQELAVISRMMTGAKDVYVTFACVGDKDKDATFSRCVSAARSLKQQAVRADVAIRDVSLTENRKHASSPALKEVAEHFSFGALAKVGGGTDFSKENGVEIIACRDIYREALACVGIVSDLLSQGARPRQIAVCAKNTGAYRGILDREFERAGIPFSTDVGRDLAASPLASLVLAAFDVCESGWRAGDIVSFLKTGLSGLTDEQADGLELYIHTWNLHTRERYGKEWQMNPDGITESEPDAEKLAAVNASREHVFAVLDGLESALAEAKTVKETANAVYTLVEDATRRTEADDDLKEQKDLLFRTLDCMVSTLGKEEMTSERFFALFRLILKEESVGKIPEWIDQVRFSDVSLMRSDGIRYVILLGVNDGEFPSGKKKDGLFADSEKRMLTALGIGFEKPDEDSAYDDVFLAYTALCSASDRAYVLYQKQTPKGEEAYSSVIVRILHSLLGIREENFDEQDVKAYTVSADALFEKYLTMEEGTEKASVKAFLSEMPSYAARIRAAERPDGTNENLRAETLAKLYGSRISGSYTRLEKFCECPFSCFCRYTLNLKPESKAELGAVEKGNIVHKVLETLLPVFAGRHEKGEKTAPEQRRKEVSEEMTRILAATFPDEAAQDGMSRRLRYWLDKLTETLCTICDALEEELSVSRFVPADLELPLAADSHAKPVSVTLGNGKTLVIGGKIDRVDLYRSEHDGQTYLRVVDYKTNRKEFRLDDIHEGLNLQMLLYLYALTSRISEKYGEVKPAGVLYRIVKREKEDKNMQDAYVGSGEASLPKCETNGLVLRDEDVVIAMDTTESGRFTPKSIVKNGKISEQSASLMDLSSLQALMQEAVDTAAALAERMTDGEKSAVPLINGRHNACDRCDIYSICHFAQTTNRTR